MASITALPPELVREILVYLPIRSLLSFGSTSKQHHALQNLSLSTLRLGVFHSRISGMVSSLDGPADAEKAHSVQVVLPRSESRSKHAIITNQNAVVRTVVGKYKHVLRELEVALWELEAHTAKSIAQARNLKHLSIRLDHPHTRHPKVDRAFWDSSPGSTVWNVLCAKHNQTGALGRLRSLNLERAGITDYQLQQILESNPEVTALRLRRCLNITAGFFEYLAQSRVGERLRTLHFTKSKSDGIDDRIMEHIGRLLCLKSLSLHGCHKIDSDLMKQLNADCWHIPDLVPPYTVGSQREFVGGIEIDPRFK